MNSVIVERARAAIVVSVAAAGVSVAITYPPLPLPAVGGGAIAPTAIAATSHVNAPGLAAANAGGIAPALIASTSVVGTPAIAPLSGPASIAPATIGPGSTVIAPTIAAAVPGAIAPALIVSTAGVGSPAIAAAGGTAIVPATIGPGSSVLSPAIAAGAVATIAPTTIVATSTVYAPTVVAGTPTSTSGVIYVGDSITEGPNQPWLRALPSRPSIFGSLTGLPIQNLGVSGRTLQDIDASWASDGMAARFNAASTNTLILLAGVNDEINAGATLAQLQGWATSEIGKAKAAGFRVGVGTILPTSYPGWTSAMETVRTSFNSWLIASATSLGIKVVDYAAIGEASNPSDTLYYHDALHPTVRLLAIMARLDASVMGVALTQRVFNPDFATGLGGWSGFSYNFGSGTPLGVDDAVLTNPSGRLRLTCLSGARTYPEAHFAVDGLTSGQSYTFAYDLVTSNYAGGGQNGARFRVSSVAGMSALAGPFAYADPGGAEKNVPGTYSGTFTATATTMYLVIQDYTDTPNAYIEVDNVRLV